VQKQSMFPAIMGLVGLALLLAVQSALAVSCCRSESATGPYGDAVAATACAEIQGSNDFDSYGSARTLWTPAGCGFSMSDFYRVLRGMCLAYPSGVRITYSSGEAGGWIYAEGSAFQAPVQVKTSVIAFLEGFCACRNG